VKSNRQFVIPFKGLKTGKHDFIFDIDDKFFDSFEDSEINKGMVHIEIQLIKSVTMLELMFDLKGTVTVMCDRCLDDFNLSISYNTNLYVKFGDTTEEQTDEILVLSHNEFELNVSQYIYEYTLLSLPYRRVHPDNDQGESMCNKEMLRKLNEYLIDENIRHPDPRWSDLNFLLNNN
jgi:uncharacterized metal-binding protein YceD (DUF177 family)